MEKDGKVYYKYCIVPMCKNTNRTAPHKVYFHMPRDANVRKKWCNAMRRDNVSSSSTLYCCEDHFNIEEDTENYIAYKIMLEQGQKIILRLKKGVIPHIFQCQKKTLPPPPVRMAALKRKRQALIQVAISEADRLEAGPSNVSVPYSMDIESIDSENKICCEATNISISNEPSTNNVLKVDKAIQVKSNVNYRSKGINVNLNVKQISISLSPFPIPCMNKSTSPLKLSSTIKRKLFADDPVEMMSITSIHSQSSVLSTDYESECSSSESSWLVDESDSDLQFNSLLRRGTLFAIEKELKMLLGLPKKSFYLIKLLSENIPLPSIDIYITLRKIKLNESFELLAFNFGYSQSTISRIFSKSIAAISEKMKELIVWPKPFDIFKKLPIAFRARYANVVSIIDCLEIQIEKPTNAVHQSLTWSQYKKCNTLKYLISCTPDGLVNYISDGYSGRATDVMIVEDCGFLDYLPPHKAIMADRGFKDLTRLLVSKNCTLIRPPSVSKSVASSKEDVKQSKQIAALRIHVERVIGRLREFNMLLPHACIDHNLVPVMDDVIIVACGLINLQNVLIKK